MYTTLHVTLVEWDEVLPMVGSTAYPAVQLWSKDMVGGPVTLQFGTPADPGIGIRKIDELMEALHRVRVDLVTRHPATKAAAAKK